MKVIEELVLVGLASEGFKMGSRPCGRAKSVKVYAQWTVNLTGPGGTQPNFSFIDVAAKALLRDLVSQLQEDPVPDPVLEIATIDMVDVRKVGWAARVVTQGATG